MKTNAAIRLRYNSEFCDLQLFKCCENKLNNCDIQLYKDDLKGSIMHSAFDFADYDFIAFGYSLLQHFILSASYDVFKIALIDLWASIRPTTNKNKIPFTIQITGIPTSSGSKNISCKVTGNISGKQKEDVISNIFELARNISDDMVKTKDKGTFYDCFNANVFMVNPDSMTISEIDLEEEIRKKSSTV